MTQALKEQFQTVVVPANDGYELSARVYGDLKKGKRLILLAGATAVPQRYYKRFALYMKDESYCVVTFDFRGIGDSKYQSLKGFEASYMHWAKQDLSGVLKWLLQYGKPLVVGHSFGGHAFGLVPEANQTLGLCTFGSGAGWHGYMPKGEMIKVLIMWNILAPILSRVYGYLPSKMVGIGENLPMGVYKQWKKWCKYPNYWFGDKRMNFEESFAKIKVPITSINAKDDKWAPLKSTKAFMSYYSSVDVKYIEIIPEAHQLKKIGHMGYFHTDNIALTKSLIETFLSEID